jgi:hypothetical protein
MPPKQRGGRNQKRMPTGARKESTRGGQENTVHGRNRRPTALTPQYREFVSQQQDLEIFEVI